MKTNLTKKQFAFFSLKTLIIVLKFIFSSTIAISASNVPPFKKITK